jgi:hypothetical protein
VVPAAIAIRSKPTGKYPVRHFPETSLKLI